MGRRGRPVCAGREQGCCSTCRGQQKRRAHARLHVPLQPGDQMQHSVDRCRGHLSCPPLPPCPVLSVSYSSRQVGLRQRTCAGQRSGRRRNRPSLLSLRTAAASAAPWQSRRLPCLASLRQCGAGCVAPVFQCRSRPVPAPSDLALGAVVATDGPVARPPSAATTPPGTPSERARFWSISVPEKASNFLPFPPKALDKALDNTAGSVCRWVKWPAWCAVRP